MKQFILLMAFTLYYFSSAYTQDNDRIYPVFSDGEKIQINALAGGFESPQIQEIDLNLDGLKDLLIVDRRGSAIRTFLNTPGSDFPFVYAPEYEKNFPNLSCWVKIRDYDGDGLDDIFSCGITDPVTGIEVWKGVEKDGSLHFEAFNHRYGPYNIIYYEKNGQYKQMYVGFNGIPAIADIDGDSDIDILAFQPSGGYLYFFKNTSVESGWGRDSLEFTFADECWGKFYEGGLIPEIFLSNDPEKCVIPDGLGTSQVRHEGVTLTAIDANEDEVMDLLIGEVSSTKMIYVENGGTVEDAFATYQEPDFPTDDFPADMLIFLASFKIDADLDGDLDIIIAPTNTFGKNTEQVWYYQKNDEAPHFQFQQKDWLVEHTVDVGSDSYPTFFDFNNDGLMDLIVGSYGIIGNELIQTKLFLYENTGNVQTPKYTLINDDYLGFSSYSEIEKSFTPASGDIDGDGDNDLIFGTLNGELVFVENIGGSGNPVQFSAPVFDYQGLDVENNTIRPDLYDVNNDGLTDIIIGGRNSYSLEDGIGSLKCFLNQGEIGNPVFTNENVISGYAGINVKEAGNSRVSGAPRFINGNQTDLVIVGNDNGRLSLYEITGVNESTLISEDFLGDRFGGKVNVDLADIDNDGYFEMVMGNERGGLNFFNTVIQTSGLISSNDPIKFPGKFSIYPNPVQDILQIEGDHSKPLSYRIFDQVGKTVISGITSDFSVNVSSLIPGFYGLSLQSDEGNFSYKFIKLD